MEPVDILGRSTAVGPARTAAPEHLGARFASALRARLWGLVVAVLTDGVSTTTTDGESLPLAVRARLPEGPLVVVANHRSHADSAALLATLGRDRPVRFAAAADYWGSSRARGWAAGALMGIWPVRRDGHGWEDLAAAEEAVRSGVVLVVYPEGTRSRDTALGAFHTGPFRLAAAAGARVLPIAVAGTERILPVHGRLHRAPIEIRWCPPLDVTDADGAARAAAERAREMISDRLVVPALARPGRAWTRAARLASSPWGPVAVFAWALAEGVSWPLVAEMPLVLLATAAARRSPRLILAAAAGSVAGILTTWWSVQHGIIPPAPLTTPRMHATAATQLAADPGAAFAAQAVNGIPVKVYAAAAGGAHLALPDLLLAVWPRALRIVVVGSLAWLTGVRLRRYLQPVLGVLQVLALLVFAVALPDVVRSWR